MQAMPRCYEGEHGTPTAAAALLLLGISSPSLWKEPPLSRVSVPLRAAPVPLSCLVSSPPFTLCSASCAFRAPPPLTSLVNHTHTHTPLDIHSGRGHILPLLPYSPTVDSVSMSQHTIHQEHIQRLTSHDAAVLRASHEFPTFASSFARVAQVGLPALEAEVGRMPASYSAKGASHSMAVSLCLPALAWDITRTCVLPVTDAVRRKTETAVAGGGALLGAADGTEEQNLTPQLPDGLGLFDRLAAICTDVSVSLWLEVVSITAAQGGGCPAEVSASGNVTRESGGDGNVAARLSTESPLCFLVQPLLPETRWHCGQRIPLAEKHVLPRPHAGRSPSCRGSGVFSSPRDCLPDVGGRARDPRSLVRLITVCQVRGLFYNLPVRQTPYVGLVDSCGNGALIGRNGSDDVAWKTRSERDRRELFRRRTSWASKSASAMRARREEQQHLVTVVFQTAVCVLLAPLYLTGTPPDASGGKDASLAQYSFLAMGASVFSAKMIVEYNFCAGAGDARRAQAEMLPLRPLSLSKPLRCNSAPRTGCDSHGIHPDSVAAAGLRVDHRGLYRGALWVCQASREVDIGGRAGRRLTRGEATAHRLCHAFGISVPNPSSASSPSATRAEVRARRLCPSSAAAASREGGAWTPEETTAEGVLTEVVVRPGHFSALFATPPPLGSSSFPASQAPSAAERLTFSPLAERHRTFFLILVRDDRARPSEHDGWCGRSAPPSSALCLTHCRVLETTHWAYSVVAANTQRHYHGVHPPPGGESSPAAVPVFLFVDSTYVPPRISEARQRARHGDSAQQSFVQLYNEALRLLAKSLNGCESQDGPFRGDENVLPAQMTPPHTTTADPEQQPPSVSRHVLPKQEAAEVQLRVRYLCQRVLEAAAVPGTQSYMPALPSTRHSTSAASLGNVTNRAGALHHVQLSPASLLWLSVTGRGVNSSVAAPRRTPVTLDRNLHRITREEEEEQAALHFRPPSQAVPSWRESPATAHHPLVAQSSNTAEGLTRMRHLLDTGRGNALRRLPRACAAPSPWMPDRGINRADESNRSDTSEGATTVSAAAIPPIATAFSASVSVLQWARKFLIIASPTTPQRASKPTRVPEAVLPRGPVYGSHPHALQWWVADQHAVHERVRLEFFLCFADTYVCHPELQHGVERTASKCLIPESGTVSQRVPRTSLSASPTAQKALERRRRVAQLLWAHPVNGDACPPSTSAAAAASFPVSLPAEWRPRVTAVEAHLCQWGWRFHHEAVAAVHREEMRCSRAVAWTNDVRVDQSTYSRTQPSLVTAIVAWPCLKVEGIVRHVTSMQALQQTVEELEAVGAAETAEFDSVLVPPQSAGTGLVSSCCRCPGPSQVRRSSSPCPLLIPSVFLDFFISRSCRGAIMFGDVLRPDAVRTMVAALDCVEQYYVCSHGRPSFTHLTPA
ncbi:hypothetical protein, conserved [Leishmania tarentolae]|uniref:Uncharacterized protein n=1 Tax=Leishmania tarentolae TaxID=5689 RepID=A0A640KEA6_LEITA|nr:hypothetical protein, conserved [Leishmania tarentolae]